jgi:hypothetical protein
MWENNSCGKFIYMINEQGPEKVDDTCVKTMHVGMDRFYCSNQRIAICIVQALPDDVSDTKSGRQQTDLLYLSVHN